VRAACTHGWGVKVRAQRRHPSLYAQPGGGLANKSLSGSGTPHSAAAAIITPLNPLQVLSVGLGIALDDSSALAVSFVVDGSPAQRAGVREGDRVLAVNGDPVARGAAPRCGRGVAGRDELRRPAARQALHQLGASEQNQRCRAFGPPSPRHGPIYPRFYASSLRRDIYPLLQEEVDLKLRRSCDARASSAAAASSSSDGDSGNSAASSSGSSNSVRGGRGGGSGAGIDNCGLDTFVSVHLQPEPLEFAPVQYGLIPAGGSNGAAGGGSGSDSRSGGDQIGYVKVITFSSTAPERLQAALEELVQQAGGSGDGDGSSRRSSSSSSSSSINGGGRTTTRLRGLILDLRDNAGGDVNAGVEAARDFLADGDMLTV
jgi:hypothetical protein